MKVEKSRYKSPEASVIHAEGGWLICVSQYMQFGSGNASGDIDDYNVVNGGSF